MYTQGQQVPAFPQQSSAFATQYHSAHSGAMHSYSHEERRAFADFINELLGNDPDLKGVLPLDPNSDALFKVVSQGLLLNKLVNAIKPGTIQEAKVAKGANPNKFVVIQNHNHAIKGCKELGCKVVSVGAEDLFAATPHLILGLIWQCVRIALLSKINLSEHPELVMLLDSSESVEKFLNVAPEVNLLRWFNYHLKKAGHPRKVNNFSSDVKDAENYLVLLEQIAPHIVPKGIHREPNPEKRAELVCQYAKQLGCGSFVTPKDILDGNEKLNLAFTAYLFNRLPGLELDETLDQQKQLQEAERLLKEKYLEEEQQRGLRWQQEEDLRRKDWELQEQQRQMKWQQDEEARKKALELESAKLRAMLSEEEQRLQQQRLADEMERRRKEHEAEEALRRLEEERRRFEEEREQARLAEAERQRQFEAEMKLREARRLEEEEKRREDDLRRMEEQRRRQFEEEERRRQEEERRKLAEEQARQIAWQEYYKQQAEDAKRKEEEEERKRKAAWEEYMRSQDEANRRRLEEEERQRQAALEAFHAKQRAIEEEERRQKAWADFYAKQAAEEEERKRQAAWTEYSQRMAAEEALRQQQLLQQQQLQQQQLQQQQLQQQQLQQQQLAAAMMTVTHTTYHPPPPVVFAPAPVFVTQTVVQPVMPVVTHTVTTTTTRTGPTFM